MPGVLLDMEPALAPEAKVPAYGFVVSHQKVELDVDFATQSLTGYTEITIIPQQRDLRSIRIDARQLSVPSGQILVNGKAATFRYDDPLGEMVIPKHISWTANQYHLQKERLASMIEDDTRAEGALHIILPRAVRIEEIDPFSDSAANALSQRAIGPSLVRTSSMAMNGVTDPLSAASTTTPRPGADQTARFQPLVVTIPFSCDHFREGLQFVGLEEMDKRFPHVYTRHSVDPGVASCIFPCIDDPGMRCTWEILIKCSRTLGDALKQHTKASPQHHHHRKGHTSGNLTNGTSGVVAEEYQVPLSDEEKLLELSVICSGELVNESIDEWDSSKRTVTFICPSIVAAQHIGFAIGPFEQVDLSEFREQEDEDKIGQNSLPIWGYCLPGKADLVRNTCFAMAHAVDWFVLTFASFPYSESKFVFVDDQAHDVEHTASLAMCSSRLLFSADIIDPEKEVVRTLVHAVATQWMGIHVVPSLPCDRWVTIGLSHYMTGLFMKTMFGNNDYHFRQKTLADRLVELDVQRPTLFSLGVILSVGDFEFDFMALKAPLILFILDKRIIKASGTTGLIRVISKIVVAANTGAGETVLSTESLRKLVEKVTKYRSTDAFWNQWIYGSGCPKFAIHQRFNKKRLCVEMKITQKQDAPVKADAAPPLTRDQFYREFKEDVHGVYAGDVQPLFTGPMTIRIHEADGTPYEHIVEIRDGAGNFEIPYNTKYKRLKRTRRQRERVAVSGVSGEVEHGEDTLYYCLGDVLQTPKEIEEWTLKDWDQEMLAKMEGESYEWIRVDADFEWLCSKEFLGGMPGYMYMSQLQQERDVVAQQESMLWLKNQPPHPLAATFLIRTLMDTRYFHGIRCMAAEILSTHAVPQIDWIGFRHLEKAYAELYCYPGSRMPRFNDFNDRAAYCVALAIPKAIAQVRGPDGLCPKPARQFILDQLRFNDNGQNDFSDNFKLAGLLSSLADCLVRRKLNDDDVLFNDEDENDDEPVRFRKDALEEIERYRRMDQWIHSYNNIFTVTALECKYKLMKAGVIPIEPRQFANYIHDGTAGAIRIKAFGALLDLGFMTHATLVAYLLNVASTDSSPYVRHRLYEELCLGLGSVAFGSGIKKAIEAPPATGDDLIVEENASNVERIAHIKRTTTIEGAMVALKAELKDNIPLKEAIWKAVNSARIGLMEQSDLLDVCHLLYEPVDAMVVNIKLPRYWEAKSLGKGMIRFTQTGKLRELKVKPKSILSIPASSISVPATPATAQPLRIFLPTSSTTTSMGPPTKSLKRPNAPERSSSSTSNDGPRPQKIIKLTVQGTKLDAIIKSPPKPASLRAMTPAAGTSPAPKLPSASPSLSLPSPRPSNQSTSPASQNTQQLEASPNPAVKIRKPLPDSVRKPLPDSVRKPLPDSAQNPPSTPPVKKPSIILKLKHLPRTE